MIAVVVSNKIHHLLPTIHAKVVEHYCDITHKHGFSAMQYTSTNGYNIFFALGLYKHPVPIVGMLCAVGCEKRKLGYIEEIQWENRWTLQIDVSS